MENFRLAICPRRVFASVNARFAASSATHFINKERGQQENQPLCREQINCPGLIANDLSGSTVPKEVRYEADGIVRDTEVRDTEDVF